MCNENNNTIQYNMEPSTPGEYLPDEILISDEDESSATVIGINDLCDSLIIVMGYDKLIKYLNDRNIMMAQKEG
jgi:hypothetical protein